MKMLQINTSYQSSVRMVLLALLLFAVSILRNTVNNPKRLSSWKYRLILVQLVLLYLFLNGSKLSFYIFIYSMIFHSIPNSAINHCCTSIKLLKPWLRLFKRLDKAWCFFAVIAAFFVPLLFSFNKHSRQIGMQFAICQQKYDLNLFGLPMNTYLYCLAALAKSTFGIPCL